MRYGRSSYNRYRNYILFNKNIIISGTFALIAGTFFTQFYSQYEKNNFVNSIVTLSVEYAVYIPLFAFLYYLDNKEKVTSIIRLPKRTANTYGEDFATMLKQRLTFEEALGSDAFRIMSKQRLKIMQRDINEQLQVAL